MWGSPLLAPSFETMASPLETPWLGVAHCRAGLRNLATGTPIRRHCTLTAPGQDWASGLGPGTSQRAWQCPPACGCLVGGEKHQVNIHSIPDQDSEGGKGSDICFRHYTGRFSRLTGVSFRSCPRPLWTDEQAEDTKIRACRWCCSPRPGTRLEGEKPQTSRTLESTRSSTSPR